MAKKIRILAIDGGGIRGVIPAQILVQVEAILRKVSRNEQAQISDYFDLVAGTSTGAIITALLLSPNPRYEAADIVDLYVKHGATIFTRSFATKTVDRLGLFNPLYQHEPIEKILRDYFGDLKISELTKPCLIPAYNIESGNATFISTLGILQNPLYDRHVRDVLRATTAAPTYFAPMTMKSGAFIDGGMFANNPALCAYIEATKFPSEPRVQDIMILSIGTGSANRAYPYEASRRWGRLNWVKPALEIYSSSASQTVDHQLAVLYEQKKEAANYLRIEPNLSDFTVNLTMDDASAKNIEALKFVGATVGKKYEQELQNFLTQVVLSNVVSSHEKLY